MEDDDVGGAAVRCHMVEELLQRLDATGRGADTDDVGAVVVPLIRNLWLVLVGRHLSRLARVL